ncbi:MAG: PLP-dependent aminotransferase family protein [Caldilineaceae bacterium]
MQPDVRALLCYGSPQGDLVAGGHDRSVAKTGRYRGAGGVIITNGLTHGLALVAQALAQPGDRVLVEQPTYLGFLNLLKAYRLEPIGVPLDEEGPQLELLEQMALQYRPRFFYTIPSYQNPTGLCVGVERRQALRLRAERHGIVLVEDDIYARLSYNGEAPPALKQYDQSGVVVYVTSESKALFPGLRIGVVVAPRPLHERILTLRRFSPTCAGHTCYSALCPLCPAQGAAPPPAPGLPYLPPPPGCHANGPAPHHASRRHLERSRLAATVSG